MPSVNHRVALISMPWAPVSTPSIALGLLKSILLKDYISCECFYLSHEYYLLCENYFKEPAQTIVDQITRDISNHSYEWLFSRQAFDFDNDKGDIFLRDLFENLTSKIACRDWSKFALIGFSCTFNQTIPSIALAKIIKKNYPLIPIILGGAGIDNDLSGEIKNHIPWIDHICVGEGEKFITNLIYHNKNTQQSPITETEFNHLPYPNYDEFYKNTNYSECSIESSRGCWYGDKILCSFCGMVPKIKYRIKKDICKEIQHIQQTYSISSIELSDLVTPIETINSICNTKMDIHISCNLRVDTIRQQNLDKLGTMYNAGFRRIFVGIESLSPPLLKLMKKGHLAINCISFLKWAKHYHIHIDWFLLFGIPGERDFHYQQQLNTLKLITHLDFPEIQSISIAKNSPYYYKLNDITPREIYKYIYPSKFNINKVATEFSADPRIIMEQVKNSYLIDKMFNIVQLWKSMRHQSSLIKRKNKISDKRQPKTIMHTLKEKESNLLDTCYLPVSSHLVHKTFDQATINSMVNNGLIIYLDNRYLTLTMPEKSISAYAQQQLNGI